MKVAERNQLQELWRQRVSDWQQSGLRQSDWCRQQQLNPHQLSYWKRKLQGKKTDSKFIPLTLTAQEPACPATLVFYIDAIRIEAAPEQAATLIKALQAIS